MRYVCQLWAQSETVSTRRVLILQKCALRIMSFSHPHSPSAPLFKSFEILFVHQHLNLQLLTFVILFTSTRLIITILPAVSAWAFLSVRGLALCVTVKSHYTFRQLLSGTILNVCIQIQASLNCLPKISNF